MLREVSGTDGIAVVFGESPVADDKELYVFEQARACPEAVALIAVYLIEGLADIHASALEFDVRQRQAVDEDGRVISSRALPCCLVLVDDLQTVVVNVLLIN